MGVGRVSKEKIERNGKGQCRTADHQEGFVSASENDESHGGCGAEE